MLQEDPSCQIATVLRRYIRKIGVNNIELALASPAIPEIITLQKGVYDVDLIRLAHYMDLYVHGVSLTLSV